MDFYGVSAASELFRIDDLLDFSNEDLFSSGSGSTTTCAAAASADQFPPSQSPQTPFPNGPSASTFANSSSTDFAHDLCFPIDDAAELEWLSQFVDDSFSNIPSNSLVGTLSRDDQRFAGRARGKRSKAVTASNATSWTSRMGEQDAPLGGGRSKVKRENQGVPAEEGVRRCTHCASEKTPQWRTGPMGPKTLCNACGVRYKSGRLVPEYRPAASPTFVLTQHSNSHRKVMELRRQKELMREQQQQLRQQQQQQVYRHRHDFEVC